MVEKWGVRPYCTSVHAALLAPVAAFAVAGKCRELSPSVVNDVLGTGRWQQKSKLAVANARRSAMENKPAQNIQDSFLNTARKEKTNITIYLLSGVKLTGRIRSFDKYSVVLETNNQEQLIFKHAISTVAMGRMSHGHAERPTPVPSASAGSTDTGSASGTEG